MAHGDHSEEPPVIRGLELGDSLAHQLVSILLLILAFAVLIGCTAKFVGAVMEHANTQVASSASAESNTPSPATASAVEAPKSISESSGGPLGRFAQDGLDYLSDLLFGVIVLELLSTLLTYIRSKKLEATIKDFLIVAIISSIRKVLLVGAQSSLEKQTSSSFVSESIGTGITILGILLLIGGLIILDWWNKRSKTSTALDHSNEEF